MKISFRDDPTEARTALVVSFDLAGFSNFCEHTEAAIYIPRLATSLFDLLDTFTVGSVSDWWNGPAPRTVVEPTYAKFTGDGALLIWINPLGKSFQVLHRTRLVEAMRAYQSAYSAAVPRWEADWQISGLPKRMRVGISKGTVFPLYSNDLIIGDPEDYVGYCVNLAVRLQNHYPEIGFVIQKTVGPQVAGLVSVMAHGIKGSRDEEVLVFESERAAARKANPQLYATKLLDLLPATVS